MTNDHIFDVTKGHCETHGLTTFICLKCAKHDREVLPRVDLALVKEVQELRAENAALREALKAAQP